MLKRGALSLIDDIDLRPFRQVLPAQITPTPAKPTGSLALLPSLVIPPRIEQMSRINARPL